jgi:hypothetical protein
MIKIPTQLKTLFWDIDFSKLNTSESPFFIIKRVLDRGNTNHVNWLLKKFKKDDIIKTISTSRDISQKTANFWADVYNLNKSQVICLQKSYSPTPFGLSS